MVDDTGAKNSSTGESKGLSEGPDRGERGQSRGGARGGKPNQSGNDSGLGGASGQSAPNLDSEINRCDFIFRRSVSYQNNFEIFGMYVDTDYFVFLELICISFFITLLDVMAWKAPLRSCWVK